MSSLRCAALACSALLAAACAGEPPPPEPAVQATSADVVFHGMRVIPGDGSPAVEDAVMIVDRGRVAALGTPDEVRHPRARRRST